jgi:tetratricopeptide (TPR) repeat protein
MPFHESIYDSINTVVNLSWRENTAIWIIISGIIGGIISQILKYIFENSLPEWQKRKATRIATQKYSGSIDQSAATLIFTIKRILDEPSLLKDNNEKTSILYNFGSFFGWIQIFLNESQLEDVFQVRGTNYRAKAKYQNYIYQLLMSFTSDYSADKDLFPETIRSLIIPRYAINSIGELMIDKSTKATDEYKKVISITDFMTQYQQSAEFKTWFMFIINLIDDVQKSKKNPQRNLLIVMYVALLTFLFRTLKVSIFISEYIPLDVQETLSKIFWLPSKIYDSLIFAKFLIQFYRNDSYGFKRYIEFFVKNKTKKKRYIKEENTRSSKIIEFVQNLFTRENKNKRLTTIKIRKEIIESDFDQLQYETIKIFPRYYNTIDSLKNLNKRIFIELVPQYFNYRFIAYDTFGWVRRRLDLRGYQRIIDSYYKRELYNIEKFISKESYIDEKNDAWNIKGIIYSYLIDDDCENFRESLYCYDKALKSESHRLEALVNKGLAFMESDGNLEANYQKAQDCFEEALNAEIGNYSNFIYYVKSNIWNYLGITYYCLQKYNEAKECFEKALELDQNYKLAADNKIITINKINEKN